MGKKSFFLCVTPDKNYEKKKKSTNVCWLFHSNFSVFYFFIQFHFPSTSSRHQMCVCVLHFYIYVCSIHELNSNNNNNVKKYSCVGVCTVGKIKVEIN